MASLLNKIEEIQKKPETTRRKILIINMIIGMTIVSVLWLANLKYVIGTKEDIEKNKSPQPLSLVWSNTKDSLNYLKETFQTEAERVSEWIKKQYQHR